MEKQNDVKQVIPFDLTLGLINFPRAIVDDVLARFGKALNVDPVCFTYGNLQLQVVYTVPLTIALAILDNYRKEFKDDLVNVVLHPHIDPSQRK